jgi:hypothetical protein
MGNMMSVPYMVRLSAMPPPKRPGRAFSVGIPAPQGSSRRPSDLHDLSALDSVWALDASTGAPRKYAVAFQDPDLCRGRMAYLPPKDGIAVREVGNPGRVAEELGAPCLLFWSGWCDIHSGQERWVASVYPGSKASTQQY